MIFYYLAESYNLTKYLSSSCKFLMLAKSLSTRILSSCPELDDSSWKFKNILGFISSSFVLEAIYASWYKCILTNHSANPTSWSRAYHQTPRNSTSCAGLTMKLPFFAENIAFSRLTISRTLCFAWTLDHRNETYRRRRLIWVPSGIIVQHLPRRSPIPLTLYHHMHTCQCGLRIVFSDITDSEVDNLFIDYINKCITYNHHSASRGSTLHLQTYQWGSSI